MRILHFATEDCRGGAAKAGYYIHRLLVDRGHESRLLVRDRATYDDPTVIQIPVSPLKYRLDRIRRRVPGWRIAARHAKGMFNFDDPDVLDDQAFLAVPREEVDVICLHWITGFLSSKRIQRICEHYRRPVIWLLNDQQPMTGGCHYSMTCNGYTRQCGNCPLLEDPSENDLSRTVWLRKKESLSLLPIVFWCGSKGTVDKVKRSSLFGGHRRFESLAPINDQVFRPLRREMAREVLRLPQDKRIVFMGATLVQDERKGMKYAVEALQKLHEMLPAGGMQRSDVALAIAGRNVDKLVQGLPFPVSNLGFLEDSVTLALAYQAADVFLCPSLDDEGPMMVSESLLCGTPVAMFQIGVAADLIQRGRTGYAATLGDATDLACGLLEILVAPNPAEMRDAARALAVAMHNPSLAMARFERELESLAGCPT